ncbi:hypothetical protein K1719_032447 [Acacia pycnantha]|nr:hypothetical protein K1719_032447 [Acacia pycnantha]
MHLDLYLQHVAEINLFGYGKCSQVMSLSVCQSLQGHTRDVKMVQWHPTMDILFSCSYDNSIKVWANEGDNDDYGHTSTVWDLSFNTSGDKMVTCSDDLTLKLWETDSTRMQSEMNLPLMLYYNQGLSKHGEPILKDKLVRGKNHAT